MYKLIAIDVDDTLINDDKIVTEATQQALEQAITKGVTVTLATGRMYASAQAIARQIGMNVPLITYQGSLVKNLLDGHVLYERSVPQDAARRIWQYAEEHSLHLQLYIDDQLYVQVDNEKTQSYAGLSKIPYIVEPDFSKLIDQPSTKMLIIDEPDYLDEVAVELRDLLGSGVHITKSKPHFLEIMHSEGTKGHALTYLAEHFGCDLSEVMAIGDAWNDREMLEVAGLGVAMGNAVPSLKEIADEITLSNNDDGVAHVIRKHILS
ncbi:Cof-type HAD-IIB family hydrolase [Paenibacillus guangzhouensis]|uniref:Cof-type HAD-IIB family hydrolase n=1 Tax=Paenibacillus guangzhouensis TaxID=1473112 RepID=UPI001266FEEE|nr:Cof-type HAD-IIB family hydrolase [Paenibacillus guangzhouensis]